MAARQVVASRLYNHYRQVPEGDVFAGEVQQLVSQKTAPVGGLAEPDDFQINPDGIIGALFQLGEPAFGVEDHGQSPDPARNIQVGVPIIRGEFHPHPALAGQSGPYILQGQGVGGNKGAQLFVIQQAKINGVENKDIGGLHKIIITIRVGEGRGGTGGGVPVRKTQAMMASIDGDDQQEQVLEKFLRLHLRPE